MISGGNKYEKKLAIVSSIIYFSILLTTPVFASNSFSSYNCNTGIQHDYTIDGWETVSNTPEYLGDDYINQPEPTGVIGNCNLGHWTNTTATKVLRATSALVITYPSGKIGVASGVMVGESTALTAAHCVYDDRYGGYATKITVYPARNENIYPFGTATVIDYSIPTSYIPNQIAQNDIAVLTLNSPIGKKSGYLSCQNIAGSKLTDAYVTVELNGYPETGHLTNGWDLSAPKKEYTVFGQMWGMGGAVLSANGKLIQHQCDTFPGHSGSGLTYISKVIGIHNRYKQGTNYNMACKIDAEYLTWINGLIK